LFSKYFRKLRYWFSTPQTTNLINKNNFVNVQLDAVGVGIASSLAPFVPVFLTRSGGSNLEVGLITSIPAITGLLLSIPLGQILARKRNIVPWYSKTRTIALMKYMIIGLMIFFVPQGRVSTVLLLIWALATIPETLLSTLFSMVMNSVAGPKGRYELMSRRWSMLGIINAVSILIIGQILERVTFPFNYQLAFIIFSLGGFFSYQAASKIEIPENIQSSPVTGIPLKKRFSAYFQTVIKEKPFVRFALKRFVTILGITMISPLLPLYYVRQIHTTDGWIAAFSMIQTTITFLAYFFWMKQFRRKGSRYVLLATTLGSCLFPLFVSITPFYWIIALLVGMAGTFEAGRSLVFFDELMKTIPTEQNASFISVAQTIQFLATMVAPFISTILANSIGIVYALMIAAAVQFAGFIFFLADKGYQEAVETVPEASQTP